MRTRFFTISDSRFYVGTVALLNSLRLTGHSHELVVLDRGFSRSQRRVLEPHCTLVELPGDHHDPFLVKPFPALLDPEGVVVLLDSDMALTDSLEQVIASAAAGRICVFPDHPADAHRWFLEWQELFDLGAPLRRDDYMNAGFVAVSADRWPRFFQRWWDACAVIPSRRSALTDPEPLAQLDQDALNAILLSEIPDDAIERLPAYEWDLRRVAVDDERTLRCIADSDGSRQPLLHAWMRPKVWQSWKRVHANAYERLIPRLLFAPDVEVRLDPASVPLWLRPGPRARLVLRAVSVYNELPTVASRARRAPRRVAQEARKRVVRAPRV